MNHTKKWRQIAAALLCALLLGALLGCTYNPPQEPDATRPQDETRENEGAGAAEYHLATSSTFSVYDSEGNPYAGYTLHISSLLPIGSSEDRVEQDHQVGVAEPLALELEGGLYTFAVSTPDCDQEYSFTVLVSRSGSDSHIDLHTAFPPPPKIVIPEEQMLDALNSLLIGVSLGAEEEIAAWSDEAVCHVMYRKLMWDPSQYSDDAWLSGLDLYSQSGGEVFSAEQVRQLARDTLGRDLPEAPNTSYMEQAGDSIIIEPAAGESTVLTVQDYTRNGSQVTAVGTIVHHYSASSEFDGYFEAVLDENPSSVYGYTLVSIRSLHENQNFSRLTAAASSVLEDDADTYGAANVIDGDYTTAWVEGVDGLGIGQWIMLSTPDGSAMDLAAIEFNVGYQKNDDILSKNGWPHTLLIECGNGYRQEVELYYYTDTVILDIPVSASWIKFTILGAQAGWKYDDICISEIRLRGLDCG